MAEALMMDSGVVAGTTSARARASRTIVHLAPRRPADDAPWELERTDWADRIDAADRDERLRRRERLLHHLEMERQRRRRRSA